MPLHANAARHPLLAPLPDNWKLCLDSTCPYTPSPPASPLDECDVGLKALKRGDQADPRQSAYCEFKVGLSYRVGQAGAAAAEAGRRTIQGECGRACRAAARAGAGGKAACALRCRPAPLAYSSSRPLRPPRPQNWRTAPNALTGHTGRCTNSDPANCHGNCDTVTGRCPTSSCIANALGDTNLNCPNSANCPLRAAAFQATCVAYNAACRTNKLPHCLGRVNCAGTACPAYQGALPAGRAGGWAGGRAAPGGVCASALARAAGRSAPGWR